MVLDISLVVLDNDVTQAKHVDYINTSSLLIMMMMMMMIKKHNQFLAGTAEPAVAR